MDRTRLWVVIGVAVVLAAFVSGLLRGMTGTSPFEPAPSPSGASTP